MDIPVLSAQVFFVSGFHVWNPCLEELYYQSLVSHLYKTDGCFFPKIDMGRGWQDSLLPWNEHCQYTESHIQLSTDSAEINNGQFLFWDQHLWRFTAILIFRQEKADAEFQQRRQQQAQLKLLGSPNFPETSACQGEILKFDPGLRCKRSRQDDHWGLTGYAIDSHWFIGCGPPLFAAR